MSFWALGIKPGIFTRTGEVIKIFLRQAVDISVDITLSTPGVISVNSLVLQPQRTLLWTKS